MSLADQLLIGWWVAVIALFIVWLVRRDLSQSSWAFFVACIVLFVSWLVIFWLNNETRLYYLNAQIFGIASLALCIWLGFFGRNHLNLRPSFHKSLRLFLLVAGAGGLIGFAIMLIEGLFLPWNVIEGRVDELRSRTWSRYGPSYQIRMNGHLYFTTNEVYSTLHVGDNIRAEGTSRPSMIFRVQPIPVTMR